MNQTSLSECIYNQTVLKQFSSDLVRDWDTSKVAFSINCTSLPIRRFWFWLIWLEGTIFINYHAHVMTKQTYPEHSTLLSFIDKSRIKKSGRAFWERLFCFDHILLHIIHNIQKVWTQSLQLIRWFPNNIIFFGKVEIWKSRLVNL